MLKIGDFARISQVSIKTLRHYDAIGLLRPARTDDATGYRFYEIGQLGDLVRILALKDCGFALDEIAQALTTRSADEIIAMLHARLVAQRLLVADEQARLRRITARLRQLGVGEVVPHVDVALKRSEPLTLLGARTVVASQREIGPFAVSVMERMEREGLWLMSPLVHLYFMEDPERDGFDMFVGAAVAGAPLDEAAWLREELPGGQLLACAIHRGDYYDQISAAYAGLGRWMSASGYQACGPCREIYHRSPAHTTDPASYITEIQFPVMAAHAEPSTFTAEE